MAGTELIRIFSVRATQWPRPSAILKARTILFIRSAMDKIRALLTVCYKDKFIFKT